jgi:hydroxymethylpyrimidine pyrophosphatase-like HAD family hydrolase
MKEGLQQSHTSEVKWPKLGKVEVGADVDFAYIIRKDGNFTMNPLAGNVATNYGLDYGTTQQVLLKEYDVFVAKLVDTFRWGYSSNGNFEVHLYDPNDLDEAVRAKSSDHPLISLDPLMHQGVHEFRVSRGYYLSGKNDFSQIARPGSDSLPLQAQNISASLHGATASVAEDDIFSGGSVIASLTALQENGVQIKKIIPGIQVGKPEKLAAMGIDVDPVVIYEATDGKNIFDKVDLGDPRDYLLGGSGLVVKLPNGEYGRSPYILPFVSTTARASIPHEAEKEFALKVLQANLEFFSNLGEQLSKPILLSQMNKDFMVMMRTMFGFDKNTPMDQVVTWAMNNIDGVWEVVQKQGELQEKLTELQLPQNIVFVDVNGTLFSDESPDGYIPQDDIEQLKQTVINAGIKGISVGLCSDSPLPQLQILAEKLGVSGPIAAENGNVLYNNGKTLVINPLSNIESYKQQIYENAQQLGIPQSEDAIAKEFGGNSPESLDQQWSFGANRLASVTVFGPSQMVQKLGEVFTGQHDISVDCSPEYNFFAIHPGYDYKQAKGKTLGTLASFGHNVIMIGNSMSDWVDPNTGVKCAFVAKSRVTSEVSEHAAYISDKLFTEGVIDIINKIH